MCARRPCVACSHTRLLMMRASKNSATAVTSMHHCARNEHHFVTLQPYTRQAAATSASMHEKRCHAAYAKSLMSLEHIIELLVIYSIIIIRILWLCMNDEEEKISQANLNISMLHEQGASFHGYFKALTIHSNIDNLFFMLFIYVRRAKRNFNDSSHQPQCFCWTEKHKSTYAHCIISFLLPSEQHCHNYNVNIVTMLVPSTSICYMAHENVIVPVE